MNCDIHMSVENCTDKKCLKSIGTQEMNALGGNNVNIYNKFKLKKQIIKLNVHRSVIPASLITLKKVTLKVSETEQPSSGALGTAATISRAAQCLVHSGGYVYL